MSLNVDRIITYDLHAGQIVVSLITRALDNLYNELYFIKYIREHISVNHIGFPIVIAAPDEGGMKTATRIVVN